MDPKVTVMIKEGGVFTNLTHGGIQFSLRWRRTIFLAFMVGMTMMGRVWIVTGKGWAGLQGRVRQIILSVLPHTLNPQYTFLPRNRDTEPGSRKMVKLCLQIATPLNIFLEEFGFPPPLLKAPIMDWRYNSLGILTFIKNRLQNQELLFPQHKCLLFTFTKTKSHLHWHLLPWLLWTVINTDATLMGGWRWKKLERRNRTGLEGRHSPGISAACSLSISRWDIYILINFTNQLLEKLSHLSKTNKKRHT